MEREYMIRAAVEDCIDHLVDTQGAGPLDFSFGDDGRIYFLMREADLAARSWDRARLVFQCH